MGKVTRYRSVLSYAKHCITEYKCRNARKVSYRIAFRQLPSSTSSLPFKEWTNDLVTELLHKSTYYEKQFGAKKGLHGDNSLWR